jgi:Raf kinase inhibitor-like YbhB/YbcL family protein
MKRPKPVFEVCVGFLSIVALSCSCSSRQSDSKGSLTPEPISGAAPTSSISALLLTSSVFASGDLIPRKYSCDGDDVSPPLAWEDVPQNAASLALIVDDPDAPAGTWVHWVLFNIPADTRALQEDFPAEAKLADGSAHGANSWKRMGYGGPCPPGGTHRYFFKLYALDAMLDLAAGVTKQDVLDAMEGHVLAQGELMGTFSRK